jgi:iron complex transport system substrate-binding protein
MPPVPLALRRLAVALVVAALMSAGCSSSAGDEGPTDPGSQQTSGAAFPVTLEHRFGTTTIEQPPQRVVTVGLTDQDALLALGIVPVATTFWFGEHPGNVFPWAREALGDAEVPDVLDSEREFEQVAALQPDLILAVYAGISRKDYDLYSEIAPVVAAPGGYVDYGTPWQEATTLIGAAVGTRSEAEALVAGVEDQVAAAREQHPEFEGRRAVTLTPWEGIFVYGPQDPRGRFLIDLGFTFPAALSDAIPEEFGGSISPERADLIDLDAVVWVDDAEDPIEELVPTYDSLDVAEQGRDVRLAPDDPAYEAMSFVTVLSLPYLLDQMVPRLAAAVDGNPSTSTAPVG